MNSGLEISRLHVLTLTPFYPSLRDNASGCFIAEPLGKLADSGVRNSVFAVQPIYRKRELADSSAPPAEFLRYWAIPSGFGLASAGAFLLARILDRVRKLHAAHAIDVIHAHGPLPCGHAAMLLGSELNIPYVVSVHGLDAYSTNQVAGRAGRWCRRVSQRVFQSAQRVICISERVREQVLAGAKSARTAVVYNGVDAEVFSPSSQQAQPRSILSIGNLIPIKGHHVLLRAMATISSAYPALELDIVGSGPERGRLAALAHDLGIAERVRFHGRVERCEVVRMLRGSILFALPSRYEGLGCVYLEAMSTGKVAIACRGQGIDEVIRHGINGWLVEPGNVEQLAAALATLLGNVALREHIGKQSRQAILEGYTLGHQAEALLRVYRECRA